MHVFLHLFLTQAAVNISLYLFIAMDRRQNRSWIDEITPPSSSNGICHGSGYLDRLIAGGDPSQRQFLSINQHNSSANTTKNRSDIKSNKKINSTIQDKLFAVNVDDEDWKAERRKKFPKFATIDISQEPVERTNTPSLILDSDTSKNDKLVKIKKNIVGDNLKRRKMTLFEKLIDGDTNV